jgi:hypothetical protein
LLKEVDTTYSNTGTDYANPTNFSNYIAVGVFPKTVTTILPARTSSLVSQDTYQYDSFGSYQDYTGLVHPFSFGQVLSSSESDWGSSAPLRTTLHTKQWQSNWNYYARNLIDLPSQDTVLAGGSTGTQVAQTSYKYDEGAYTNNLTTWGLPTTVKRWLSGGASPTTHNYYTADVPCTFTPTVNCASAGMPIKKQDVDGYITSLAYDSSGLYLSNITYPDLSFESPTYDDNTGLLKSNLDVNSQPTSYAYDTMRRLTQVKYPDNGWETLNYNDTAATFQSLSRKGLLNRFFLRVKYALI